MKSFDFEFDLKEEIHKVFKPYGVRISKDQHVLHMLYDFITVRKKIIEPKPRRVLLSPVLNQKLKGHTKRKEIEQIIKWVQEGANINVLQSNKMFQSQFHDFLLYEWNIRHFHLSLKKQPNSYFFKRTKQLLFGYFDPKRDVVLFLDTDEHREGVFADIKWFEILHEYFPEFIRDFIAKDMPPIKKNLTSSERQKFRDYGYSTGMLMVNDVMYFSPGIGITISGHSMSVISTGNEVIRWFNLVNDQFAKYYEDICLFLKIPINDAQFHMRIGPRTIEIHEKSSHQVILEYPNSFEIQENTEKLA